MDIWSYMLGAKRGGGSPGGGGGGGGGGTSATEKDVNYYDYDGTVLYSYTKAEALALTEEPPLPERAGLICQGWNVSLEDMQSYVRKYGMRDVGATYTTDDGKTRIYIHLEEGRTSPMLGVCPNGTVTVDWGDSTVPDVLTGTSTSTVKWTPNHEYATAGDYVITLTVDGEMVLKGENSANAYTYILRNSSKSDGANIAYHNALQKVEIGSNVTSIENYAFSNCNNLSNIIIPNSVTRIGNYAFTTCYALASIVIPDGITSIGEDAFYCCYSLASIVIPNKVTEINYRAINNCVKLTRFSIPDGVTKIYANMSYGCYNLANVVIPNSVTSIENYAFNQCYNLSNIIIPNSVTRIGSSAFSTCYNLANVVIPDKVTKIGSSAFSNCSSFTSIVIPNGVTDIDNSTFINCKSLISITVLGNITSIGTSAFANCNGLKICDLTNCTAVPTLASTSAITNIAADFEIRVPAALVDEWKAATNWSTYANNIVGV